LMFAGFHLTGAKPRPAVAAPAVTAPPGAVVTS
jgi:hypothetical protein